MRGMGLASIVMVLLFQGVGLSQQVSPLVAEFGYADLILANGKIVSMEDRSGTPDSPGRVYQAMAVKGKKIMALGTNDEMQPLADPNTRRIDLGGRTVIPGLMETHAHTYGSALTRYGPQVGVVTPDVNLAVDTQSSPEATAKAIRDTIANAIQAQKLPAGQWISVHVQDSKLAPSNAAAAWLYTGKVTRRQIDSVSGKNPVGISANLANMYNTRAIEELKKVFPEWEEHAEEENGPGSVADGYEGIMTRGSIGPEYWWKNEPLEKFAEAFRLHGEDLIKWGLTTITTRIPPPRYISAYYLLNRQGRLPHRLVWHIEVHRGRLESIASTRKFYQTVGAQWTTMESGNDMMWLDGMANEIWDSLRSETCFGPDLPAPPEIKARERCPGPGSKPWEAYRAAILNGWRPVDSHGVGSHGIRLYIQMLDAVAKEGNFSTEYIRSLRPSFEHCIMIGKKPDVIAGLKKYGIILSVAPRLFGEVNEAIRDYGSGALEFVMPTKTWIKEGIKLVGQLDNTDLSGRFNVFTNLYQLVTRKALGGRSGQWSESEEELKTAPVYVPEEAIDRVTALKLWTTWSAEYVLAENHLGTLERGKYADFVVLDRDYFTVPVDEIPKVRVVMTGLNGKIAYDRDQLAGAN
ncbi:MAG: amidohydrolase family protein [Acidobacteria bacterium]|nr:amidohydrolase family protein [Acidobacteriota bacterium]